ncbi:MAG: hypothetical protein EOO92_18155 [Pedobacter sp.]|nr:MAG: hypothetical protein EOO92_18155 [Pedobacter sp.]
MSEQNINPNTTNEKTKTGNLNKTGLDEWNDRLDNNLEPEKQGDISADENAENYQKEADTRASKED